MARALRLAPDGHGHLRMLAGLPNLAPPLASALPGDQLQQMLDSLDPNPAYIVNQRFDWNTTYTRVWKDPRQLPDDRRNLLWAMFTDPDMRRILPGWEHRALALLAQLRVNLGPHVGDPRAINLIESLTAASSEFHDWWGQHHLRDFHNDLSIVNHPELGQIALDLVQLRLVEQPALTLILQTPANEHSRRVLRV